MTKKDQNLQYVVNGIFLNEREIEMLFCFDNAVFEYNAFLQNDYGSGRGFTETAYFIKELIDCFGIHDVATLQENIKSVAKKLFNTGMGQSDNLNKIYPGHGIVLRDELIGLFGTGKAHGPYHPRICMDDEKQKYKRHVFLSNTTQEKTPELAPPPQDLQADIHLMAMTILEKLQPVLLNAIYTELMEHKK